MSKNGKDKIARAKINSLSADVSNQILLDNNNTSNCEVTPTLNGDGLPITVIHEKNGSAIRIDTFDYTNANTPVETRTLLTGKKVVLTHHNDTGKIDTSEITATTQTSHITLTNLLGNDGNFEVDTNEDGLCNNWTKANCNTLSMSNNVQSFHPTSQWGGITYNIDPHIVIGHKYYFCVYVQSIGNVDAAAMFMTSQYVGSGLVRIGTSSDFVFLSSDIITATVKDSTYARLEVNHPVAGATPAGITISVKKAMVIDVTNIALTKTQMDTLVKAKGYFTTALYMV